MADKLTEIEMILKKYIREQNAHNQRMNNFATSQEIVNTKVSEDMDELKRGLYGDPKNKVSGLIDRQTKSESDIKGIKTRNARLGWYGAGFITAINGIIYFIKELVHK
jgi:hypothetical protein